MNIITGSFVQAALKAAESEKKLAFYNLACNLLKKADSQEDSHMLNCKEFETCLCNPEFMSLMQSVSVDTGEAMALFGFLDEGSGLVSREELLEGLVRLHTGIRFIDMLT